MKWLRSKSFNNADIARQIGLTPSMLKNKIDGRNGNRLTESDLAKLEMVRAALAELLALPVEMPTVE